MILKFKKCAVVIFLFIFLLGTSITQIAINSEAETDYSDDNDSRREIKKNEKTESTLEQLEEQQDVAPKIEELVLNSKAAVLMDGTSGRILYEKNGTEVLPMASTTKIMTCILALENGKEDDLVQVSKYAASMPDVQLNIREGEYYKLKDLLYSLMLESHNDTAVAVAEYIGGTVETFAGMMNEKAKQIGCENTFFITPNGLDASQVINDHQKSETKVHSTTAADLARIMRYCVMISPQKDAFCEITQTPAYSFCNQDDEGKNGGRSFSCVNHNAFLQMWKGAISGKTGFTGKAGYCYVGACDTKCGVLIGSLLASGWPPEKTRKWQDMKALLQYGESYFQSYTQQPETKEWNVMIENGSKSMCKVFGRVETGHTILKSKLDKIKKIVIINQNLKAPVACNEKIGEIRYELNGHLWFREPVYTIETIEKITIMDKLDNILQKWVL